MFGPLVIGKFNFVARTISSRFAYSLSARPVTSSLAPSEYMSAVSKKLMPDSTALRKNGLAAGSSRTHGRHLELPKLMHPRARRETVRPVRPSCVYSIEGYYCRIGDSAPSGDSACVAT